LIYFESVRNYMPGTPQERRAEVAEEKRRRESALMTTRGSMGGKGLKEGRGSSIGGFDRTPAKWGAPGKEITLKNGNNRGPEEGF